MAHYYPGTSDYTQQRQTSNPSYPSSEYSHYQQQQPGHTQATPRTHQRQQYGQQPQYGQPPQYDQQPHYAHPSQYSQQSQYDHSSQYTQQSQQYNQQYNQQYQYPPQSQYDQQAQYGHGTQYDQHPQYNRGSQYGQQHGHPSQGYQSSAQPTSYSSYQNHGRNDSVADHHASNDGQQAAVMPDPLDPSTRALLPDLIEGTPSKGWYEPLDSSYRMRTGMEARQFFRVGRVFAMLYSEAASETAARRGNENDAITVVRFGGAVYSQIRRFVVVNVKHGFVKACAISTYSHRGVLKPGCDPAEHTIVYAQGTSPTYINGEIDAGLVKEPIEIIPADNTVTIDSFSRLRLGKTYPIEWNVKVKDIGQVHPEHLSKLLLYWKNCEFGEEEA